MTSEKLQQLIKEWENAKVDFKREWYWNENMPNNIKEVQKNELVKDLIALTNGDVYSTDKTAYLIIGIDDETKEAYDFDKSVVFARDKLKQQLLTLLNNYAQPEFLALDIEFVDEVLVISIPPRGSLISLSKDLKLKNNNIDKKGTTYYRVGEDIRVASSEVVGEFEKGYTSNGNLKNITEFDKKLFNEFLFDLPISGAISYIYEFDFHYIFKIDNINELFRFSDKWDNAEYEFINQDLETKRLEFYKELNIFLDELGIVSSSIDGKGMQSIIPQEFRIGKKPSYLLESVEKINNLSKEVYKLHQEFIRLGKELIYG